MKFLLDQDVPEDLTYLLREPNHEVLRLRDILPLEATDAAVFASAAEPDCLLTTCNRDDFLQLAETQRHRGIIASSDARQGLRKGRRCCACWSDQVKAVSVTTSTSPKSDQLTERE